MRSRSVGVPFLRRQSEGNAIDRAVTFQNKPGDITGAVASMTESDPGVLSEKAPNHALVLTGTTVRGGQAAWVFSWT